MNYPNVTNVTWTQQGFWLFMFEARAPTHHHHWPIPSLKMSYDGNVTWDTCAT
ncbi:MAG: hypothetical protein U5K75_02190 [Ahrensia sp.]|nr:hypothetical protein [Ahrensia sp.]